MEQNSHSFLVNWHLRNFAIDILEFRVAIENFKYIIKTLLIDLQDLHPPNFVRQSLSSVWEN